MTLAPLDLAIVGVYFALVVAIGVWVSRRTSTEEDLFLAGRSLGFGVIGLSLFASNISSTTLIGLTGQAYASGISVANYEWMAGLVLAFMAVFVIPLYLSARVTTIPEFLERRFDRRARYYLSAMSLVTSIVVDTAGSLYAGALVVQLFFPGVAIWQTCLAIALFTGIYTAAGGLRAVVYTDVLQTVVLLGGSIVLAGVVFARFDFSWGAMRAAIPADHLSLIRPLDDPALPWLGTLIGVPVLGFYFWAMNQFIVQRILGARNVQHAQRGALLAGLLKLAPLFVMVLPGALALQLFPGLDNPDLVFPTLVRELLPVGATGLVMAGLMAAIMSSIDSTLNSASTLLTVDFVQPRRGPLSHRQLAWIGRLATLGFMALAAAWAPTIQQFPGLFAYLQQMLAYIVPPLVAIFLTGLFWRGVSRDAAFWTLPIGHAACLTTFVLNELGALDVHFTIMAGILTAGCAVLCIALSLWLPQAEPQPELARLTWPPQTRLRALGSGGTWWQDYRLQSGIVVLATAATVIAFW